MYLTDSEYQGLLISHPDNGLIASHFDVLYERIKEMRPEISSSFNYYLTAFAAVLLARFHLLASIEAPGMKIASEAIQHVLLIGWSYFQFKLSYLFAKHNYVQAIFERHANRLSPAKRALFVARYPFAFFVLRYYPSTIGNPPYLFRPGFPVQALLALLFTVVGLAGYLAISTWLFCSTALNLWNAPTNIPATASRGIIVVAAALAVAGWLLPSNWLIKRKYTHTGLVDLMTRFHRTNHARWVHFVGQIDLAQRNLGLKK